MALGFRDQAAVRAKEGSPDEGPEEDQIQAPSQAQGQGPLMDRASLQRGRDFEKTVAKMIGAKLVPASGATWHAKLDLGRAKLIFSLKSTGASSFRLTKSLFDEVRDAIVGPGGLGADWTGGMIVDIDNEAYVVVPLLDFVELMKDPGAATIPPTKTDEKRAGSKRSLLGVAR